MPKPRTRKEILDQLREIIPGHPVTNVAELNDVLALIPTVANLISQVAGVDHIPRYKAVSFRWLFLEPDDVYKDNLFCKDDERAPTQDGVLKLWRAAGGRDVPGGSARVDDRSDSLRQEFRVEVSLPGIDGKPATTVKTREVDLRPGSAETKSMEKWPKRLAGARQNTGRLAESKARLRAIRAALGVKQKYTIEQLERPFVIPALVALLPTDDEAINRLVAADALGVVEQVFGPSNHRPQLLPAEPMLVDRETGEVIEGQVIESDAATDADYDVPPPQEYACECPCGHAVPMAQSDYERSHEAIETARCRKCYPSKNSFDVKAHEDVSDLKLPGRPDLTVTRLAELQKGAA